jgi:hypothetical protein
MTDQVSRIIQIDGDQDLALLREIAHEQGVSAEPAGVRAAIDPVTAMAIVTGAAYAVNATVERWRERRKGGQVVDLRPGAPKVVYRDRGVLFGYVVILLADGHVQVHLKEPADHLAQIIRQLTEIGSAAGVDKAVDVIESITGDEAVIRVSR